MIEKDVLQKAKLDVWQIIALYLYNDGVIRGHNPTEIIMDLMPIVRICMPDFSEEECKFIIKQELVRNCRSEMPNTQRPYFNKSMGWRLSKIGQNWISGQDKMLNFYNQFIKPHITQTVKVNKKNQILGEPYKILKQKLEQKIKENKNFLLGQLEIDALDYKYLKKYAKMRIETNNFAHQNDLLLVIALMKIAQKNATEWRDIWKVINKVLNVSTKKIIKIGSKSYTLQHGIEKIFKDTISFYNSNRGTDLYLNKYKNNSQNIACHCFVFDKKDKTTRYFETLKKCYNRNHNFTINDFRNSLLKDRTFNQNIIDVINSQYDKVERLLAIQVEYIKTRSPELKNNDHFVKKLSEYLDGTLDTMQNNVLLREDGTNQGNEPSYSLGTNYNLYIHIPKQDIKDKAKIVLKTAIGKEIMPPIENLYLYNNSYNIPIDRQHYQYVFEDINVIIQSDNEHPKIYSIVGKPYRFFEKNGEERADISSVSKNPAVILMKNNISICKSDIIREDENKENYKIYLVSLQDRNRHIEIDNKIYNLNKIEKDHLELEGLHIENIQCLAEKILCYSSLPQIIVKKIEDMKNAKIKITNLKTKEEKELNINNAREVFSGNSEDTFLVFDMENTTKRDVFYNINTAYRVDYKNQNANISKKFIYIDNIQIDFIEDLYFDTENIKFWINKPYRLTNVNLLEHKNDLFLYKSQKDTDGNIKPIEFVISENYTFQVIVPLIKFSLDYKTPRPFLEHQNKYIREDDISDKFKLLIPSLLDLKSTPVLDLEDNNLEKKSIEFKYVRKKDCDKNSDEELYIDRYRIRENETSNHAYKQKLSLRIETNKKAYLKEIGILYNYPIGNTNINVDEDDNLIIQADYYPQVNIRISNDKGILYDEELYDDEVLNPTYKDEIIIPKNKLNNKEDIQIILYTDNNEILKNIQYKYLTKDTICVEELKVYSLYLLDGRKCDVDYYIIDDIEQTDNTCYYGDVCYCTKGNTKQKICSLFFDLKKQGNEYVVIPQGQNDLVYGSIGRRWILTNSNKQRCNILKIMCK